MTRAIFTWFAGVGLLACTQTTRLHMEEVENGGAAGESQTADTAEASTDEATAGDVDAAAKEESGVGGSVSDGH